MKKPKAVKAWMVWHWNRFQPDESGYMAGIYESEDRAQLHCDGFDGKFNTDAAVEVLITPLPRRSPGKRRKS